MFLALPRIVLGISLLAVPFLGAEEQFLPNPTFDETGADAEAAWKGFPIRGSAKGTINRVAEGRSGSALLIHTAETMDGWMQPSAAIRGGIVAGQDYELRVWLKGDRFVHNAALLIHNDTHWFPVDLVSMGINVGKEWTEQVMRFRAGVTDPKARAAIRLVQEAKLWVDDFTLRPLAPALSVSGGAGKNLIRNGSFEVGMTGWAPEQTIGSLEESPDAPHGKRVHRFHVFNAGKLNTVLMAAESGHKATVSFSIKAKAPAKLTLLLRSGYAAMTPPGPETTSNGPETVVLSKVVDVTTEWQRISHSVILPPVPNGSYYLTLAPTSETTFWLDAVQFELASEASPFQPKKPLEAGIVLNGPEATYRRGDPVAGMLSVWNENAEPVTSPCQLRAYDVWDKSIVERSLDLTFPPGRSEHPLSALEPGRTGAFRAEVLEPGGQLLAEAVYAVLPEATPLDPFTSALGTHVDFAAPGRMAQAGARWTKSWWLSWENLEPEPGTWVYARDNSIAAWREAGMEILAVLGVPPRRDQVIPENPLSWGWYPPADYGKLRDYARRVVERHRDRIRAWEMTNEPNSGLHRGAESTGAVAYAKQWRAMAEGVRAADPKAIIVGGSITLEDDPATWLRGIVASDPGLLELCDVVSYHNYTPEPETIDRITDRLRQALQDLGKPMPIWDTEWAPVKSTMPFYRDAPRNLSLDAVPAREAAAMVVRGHVARLGAGLERSFVYHGYGSVSMNRYEFDLFTELGGAPRPAVAAQAVLARALNGCVFEAREAIAGTWTYRFRTREGESLLIAWMKADEDPREVELPGTWLPSDMMGNPLHAKPVSRLFLGHDPVYLRP